MSGRIDAAVRFMNVTERSLREARTHVDTFMTVITTEKDLARRSTDGKAALLRASESTNQALAGVAAAKVGSQQVDGIHAGAIDQAQAGVLELRSQLATLLKGGDGSTSVNPAGVQTQVEEARSSAVAARNTLQAHADSGTPADEALFEQIGRDTKAAKLDGVTDAHVDGVVAAAAKADDAATRMPRLTEIGVDMIAKAREGRYERLIGREPEVDQLLTVLGRKRKANPMLLGDPGVGKTQLVEGLALRVARGEVPESMRDLQIYSLDGAALKAAAGGEQGGMEKLVKEILEELANETHRGGNIAIFADEVHTLMAAGDLSQQIKPALARGELKLIGATTFNEYKKHFAKDGALVRRVAPITVDELDKKQVLDVLRSVQVGLSEHHGVDAYEEAVQEVLTISSRYVKDRKQPDPAIELMDHAMSRVAKSWFGGVPPEQLAMSNELTQHRANVPMFTRQVAVGDPRAAAQLVSAKARIAELEPKVEAATTQLAKEREVIGARFELVQRYFAHLDAGEADQAAAIEPQLAVANAAVDALRVEFPERIVTDVVDATAVREAAADLYNRTISAGGAEEAKRALGLGDELAKLVIGQRPATDLVADTMMKVKANMHQGDKPAGVFMLVGPTGVGKTETVKGAAQVMTGDRENFIRIDMSEFQAPQSISKLIGAAPEYVGYGEPSPLEEILQKPDAFLLLDEIEKAHPDVATALMTMFGEGHITVNGTRIDATGITAFMTSNLPVDRIDKFFRPEVLNRIDEIVEYQPLNRDHVSQILVDHKLPGVLDLALSNGLKISVSDAATSRIIDYGFDPVKGARPLERSVKSHVTDPTSRMILEMRSAGHVLDPDMPQEAVLDIDPSGSGFIMRSADGSVSVPIKAKLAEDHVPGAARAAPRALSSLESPAAAGRPPQPSTATQTW